MTNSEIAQQLRLPENEHQSQLACEALARLLEAAEKDHQALINEGVQWRVLLEELVLAAEFSLCNGPEALSKLRAACNKVRLQLIRHPLTEEAFLLPGEDPATFRQEPYPHQ